ncbi:SurA N-terminal domain-containing protein [Hippea alviniae]|uniref:SurA N-terminal domain-containing protein n=1 Tax=Hippea alviniae TaxID=1279027 RepID=UPI0003B44B34|nr:SurA N-terminal domain-containing protein [Hippea alviniae]
MLDFLRKNIKKFAILLWIAAAAFIIGGAYLFVRGPFTMGSNTAIEVGDIKISIPEYEKTYNDIYKFYIQLISQLKGGNITEEDIKKLNIKQKTIDMLIERALLIEEAKREGIKVTDEDVIKAIQSNPAFFVNGKFSKEKYLALLKANNINPKEYEESLKTSLYITKLKEKLFKNVKITDKEVKKFFDKNYSKVNIEFVVFNWKDFEKSIKVNDKELKKYYLLHKEKYRVPTMVKFEYIAVPLSYVEKKVKVSDEEAKKFYEEHKSYFKVPLRIRVAHILFAKKDNQTDEELKQEAERVYKLLKDKKITFKEAVKEYSADKLTKNVGGDLGYITKNMVIDSFWNAIVKLKKGEISKPFKTKFGYHIALIEDIKEPFIRPFDKVKKDIINYLKETKAKKIWFVEADKIFVKIRDSKESLKKAAKEYGLKLKESPFISLKNPKQPFTEAMIQNAILAQKGKLFGPDLSSEGYLIYKLVDKKPSYIPKFEQVKDKVKKDYIEEQAKKLAYEKAKEILKLAKEEKSLEKVAKEKKLKIKTVKNMTKLTPTKKFACSFNEKAIEDIFSHDKGYLNLCKTDGNVYVYQITDKIFDKKEFEKLKDSIKQQLLAQKEDEILSNLIEKLKRETKIKINPKL